MQEPPELEIVSVVSEVGLVCSSQESDPVGLSDFHERLLLAQSHKPFCAGCRLAMDFLHSLQPSTSTSLYTQAE